MRGRTLLWLYDTNITQFMKFEAGSVIRHVCPNCTFMWIGMMQSVLKDYKFFWKRTQQETQTICHKSVSNITCEFNVTKEQSEILGCCFSGYSCSYPGDVKMDRRKEFNELNHALHGSSSPGYRRCVGLHKVSVNGEYWIFSVDVCSRNIPYEHGYFCEFRCGSSWPVPKLSTTSMVMSYLLPQLRATWICHQTQLQQRQ